MKLRINGNCKSEMEIFIKNVQKQYEITDRFEIENYSDYTDKYYIELTLKDTNLSFICEKDDATETKKEINIDKKITSSLKSETKIDKATIKTNNTPKKTRAIKSKCNLKDKKNIKINSYYIEKDKSSLVKVTKIDKEDHNTPYKCSIFDKSAKETNSKWFSENELTPITAFSKAKTKEPMTVLTMRKILAEWESYLKVSNLSILNEKDL